MRIEYVETLDQALDMARVRNSGREYMTHDQHEISPAEQASWFEKHYLPLNVAGYTHGFVGYEESTPIAYGLVNLLDEDYWLTGVIDPDYRGNGYGEYLFRHLSEFTLGMSPRVMLDVLASNDRAQRLYEKLGYKALHRDGERIVMCLDKEDYAAQPANI